MATFVGPAQAGDGQTATVTSLSLTIPAGASVGDRALLFVDSSDSAMAFTTPTGWSVLDGPTANGTSAATAVLEKTLAAGEPGSTLTLNFTSAAARAVMFCLVFSGATGTTTLAVAQDTAAVTSYTLPTIGSVAAGSVQVGVFLRRRSGASGSITIPAGYTAPASPGGSPATAYGTGANVFAGSGYILSSSSGTVGGESGSTGVSSIGANYLLVVPTAQIASGSLARTGSGALTLTGSIGGSLAQSGAGALSLGQASAAAAGALARTGSGSLALAPSSISAVGSLARTGSGALALAGAPKLTGSLARTGTGQLTLSGAVAFRYSWWDGVTYRHLTPLVWDGQRYRTDVVVNVISSH